jgi:Tfp pilus assembly protein PilO
MQQREKYLLISFGVLLVLVSLWYVVWPTYVRYTELDQKIRNHVRKIQSAQREAAQIGQLVDDLVETKRELKLARLKLPEEGRFNQLMSTLEEQALEAGIPEQNIVAFNRGSLSEGSKGLLQEMTIEAQFESMSMVQLTDVLWRFNQLRRLIDVKKFNMERSGSGSVPRYNVNVTLAVYTLDETGDEEATEA